MLIDSQVHCDGIGSPSSWKRDALVLAKVFDRFRNFWTTLTNGSPALSMTLAIGVTSLTITGGVLGLRQLGVLQPLELAVYDQLVRLRPDVGPDDRLLIVAITEADIKAENRFPLSDRTIATALQRLQRFQPRVIGLDVYRDLPQEPGQALLAKELQRSNLIAITKLPDPDDLGVPAPPHVPADRVGFNDIPSDPDGVIRRTLMFANLDDSTDLYAFSVRLALAYLKPKLELQTVNDTVQLGTTQFTPWEQDSGPYQTIDARGYQVLLNYRDRHHLARQVTLTQVLHGDLKPEWVKDKIVLIGTTARSAKDVFLTPYSATEPETPWMPGVVVHAQMVSQILSTALDQQPLTWFWSNEAEIVWISIWAVVGGLLAWFIRHPLLSAGMSIGAVGLLLSSGYILFLNHGWIPLAAPFLALTTTATTIVTHRAQQAQRQQQMMMKLLGQNTSPEIATALWNSRDRLLKSGKLPGQRLVATMLFTDIKNFSTISEQLPPEALLEWLNEYLSAITQEVRTHHGIINKFTGDGMLAAFGVPVNRTIPIEISHDAQLAVACALTMGQRLTQLNQDWHKRGLPIIQMRVGIFTGPIVAGSLGGKARLEYGLIGDSVNIASRLESYEKERQPDTEVCRVLIAKETLIHLQDKFVVEPWGPIALKGKHCLVQIYRVLGFASATASADA